VIAEPACRSGSLVVVLELGAKLILNPRPRAAQASPAG
jgi:hypothetical protein